MIGNGGSGDALASWLLVMAAGAAFGLVGGGLAYAGRWRAWHGHGGPFPYVPLAAVPFGLGCLIELLAAPFRPPPAAAAVLAGVLVACALGTCLLFLRFPGWLKPSWVRRAEGILTPAGAEPSEPG
ncbi:MAG: hypothetical protein ACREPI_12520 [Candidatus Dormibacterales bacterium]